jgi:hypothetical protein
LPSNSPHDHMILREDLVGSQLASAKRAMDALKTHASELQTSVSRGEHALLAASEQKKTLGAEWMAVRGRLGAMEVCLSLCLAHTVSSHRLSH